MGALRRLSTPTNLLTSVLLVFPLFLAYQVGVLVAPNAYNGADLITARLLALAHQSIGVYLLVNLALALAFALALLVLRRKQGFDARLFLPVVLESAVYALTMGTVIVHVMQLLHISPTLAISTAAAAAPVAPAEQGLLTRIVIAVGAGVHEELVFRLILMGGIIAIAELVGTRRWLAVTIGFVVSAVLFSAAHHVIGGEPFRVGAFVYRIFCGLFFAALYRWRGFAVAIYTHAFYDIFVLVLHG